jgi:hypothetical protein
MICNPCGSIPSSTINLLTVDYLAGAYVGENRVSKLKAESEGSAWLFAEEA